MALATAVVTTSVADRLSSMLFVTALAHGMVILGVTFAGDPFADPTDAPPLSVTLLLDSHAAADSDAALLASQNSRGGGQLDDSNRPTTMLSAAEPLTQLGEIFAADLEHARPREAAPEVEQLATSSHQDRRIQAVPEATKSPAPIPMRAAALLNQTIPQTLAAEIDEATRGHNDDASDAPSAPSARESIVAAYLVGWRQRIEKIGTANFPQDYLARDGTPSRPVLEVAIGAEGQLQEIVVRRSSGNAGLDQAALQILRMAAPFDPLPPAILADRDVLRVVYEWDFTAG